MQIRPNKLYVQKTNRSSQMGKCFPYKYTDARPWLTKVHIYEVRTPSITILHGSLETILKIIYTRNNVCGRVVRFFPY